MLRLAILLSAALLLAACAATGTPKVTVSGAEPLRPGASFAILRAGDPAEAVVARALRQAGLRPAPAESADYLVQVAFADRSARVGAYVPSDGADPDWVAPAVGGGPLNLHRRVAYDLSVIATERASGRDLRRSTVRRFAWRDRAEAALPTLAQAAVAPLIEPAP